jgi:hypothetical protein
VSRIHDFFTNCAVYIYKSLEEARNGEHYGGSGFLVSVSLKENPDWWNGYVVTNAHVVRRAKTPVIRINRINGGIECISTKAENWFSHDCGDDIAVFPLDVEYNKLKFWALDLKDFVTQKLIHDEDIGIGDETVMVGRFVNHEGRQQNSPAVRFGSIAMMATEKIITNEGLEQEAFLVEVRSLPGYSGSAVFIYTPHAINDMSERRFGRKKGEWAEGEDPSKRVEGHTTITTLPMPNLDYLNPKGPYLLGIDFCHIHRKVSVREKNGNEVSDGWYVEENTGMAGVIPAWKIVEVLNVEELRAMRDKEDHEITKRKSKSGASLDSVQAEESTKTQITAQGVEIPIPTTDQFLGDLEKASRRKD